MDLGLGIIMKPNYFNLEPKECCYCKKVRRAQIFMIDSEYGPVCFLCQAKHWYSQKDHHRKIVASPDEYEKMSEEERKEYDEL